MASTLTPAELYTLESLVTPTAQGIASRVLARTGAGNITLFAFDAGEELSEHTAPFDALALTPAHWCSQSAESTFVPHLRLSF